MSLGQSSIRLPYAQILYSPSFMCFQVGRTLASVGCAVDAKLGRGTGVVWPITYFGGDVPTKKTHLITHPYLRVSYQCALRVD